MPPDGLPDDREDPPELFVRADRRRAGTGRLATDLDDVGPLREELLDASDRTAGDQKITPVAEAIGGNVDDADDGHLRQEPPPAHRRAAGAPAWGGPPARWSRGPAGPAVEMTTDGVAAPR